MRYYHYLSQLRALDQIRNIHVSYEGLLCLANVKSAMYACKTMVLKFYVIIHVSQVIKSILQA